MTKETITSAADPGLQPRLTAYLALLQTDALQLEKLLEAANSLAGDDRRSELTLEVIVAALEIAKHLQVALDSVTVRKEIAACAGMEGRA